MDKRHSLFCVRGVYMCVCVCAEERGLVKIKMNVLARVGVAMKTYWLTYISNVVYSHTF